MTEGYKIRNQQALHFLTFTVINWIDVFTRIAYKDNIIDSLIYCQQNKVLNIHAFVIMTNHMHSILSTDEGSLSNIIRDFKKFTGREIIKTMMNEAESRRHWMLNQFEYAAKSNKRNSDHQFWIQNNHPIELNSNYIIDQKLDYVHNNPVKDGIVYRPEDYVYSSASNYADLGGLMEIDFLD